MSSETAVVAEFGGLVPEETALCGLADPLAFPSELVDEGVEVLIVYSKRDGGRRAGQVVQLEL